MTNSRNIWFGVRDGRVLLEQRGPDVRADDIQAPWARLGRDGAQEVSKLTGLQALSLSGRHFPSSDADAEWIRQIRHDHAPRSLSVNAATLAVSSLRDIVRNLRDLRDLDIQGTDTDDTVLAALLKASPRLTHLSMGWRKSRREHRFPPALLNSDALDHISLFSELEHLSIRDLQLSEDELLVTIRDFRLKALDCAGTPLSKSALEKILGKNNLRVLGVENCGLNDECGEVLAQHPELETLSLSGNPIGNAAVQEFANFESELRMLDLSASAITDASLTHLARLPDLARLDVSNTNVTSAGLAQFGGSARHLRHLRALGTLLGAEDIALDLSRNCAASLNTYRVAKERRHGITTLSGIPG